MKKFNIFQKNNNNIKNNIDYELISEQYYEIGKLVKEARIKKHLSIKQLSDISKISESNIFAIENNINELRPKYPFIRSILLKLEKCLTLNKNSLAGLALKETNNSIRGEKNLIIRKFDFINSWQGNIFYFLFLILTLFILNRYFISNVNVIEIQIIEKINEK